MRSLLRNKIGKIIALTAITFILTLGIFIRIFSLFESRAVRTQERLFSEQQLLQTQLAVKALQKELDLYTRALAYIVQKPIQRHINHNVTFSLLQSNLKNLSHAFPDLVFAAFYPSPKIQEIIFTQNSKLSPTHASDISQLIQTNWSSLFTAISPPHSISFSISQKYQLAHILLPFNASDSRQGILLVSVNLRPIVERYIAPLRSGKFGAAYLLSGDGTIIFDHEQEIIGRNIFDSMHKDYPELKKIDQRLITEITGTGKYSFTIARNGQTREKYTAWSAATMDQSGKKLIVVMSAPEEEINYHLTMLRPLNSILAAAMLLLAIAVTIMINIALSRQKILKSKQHLLNIIDFLPDATFVLDASNRVIAWNKSMEQLTGISKTQIMGRNDVAEMLFGYPRPLLTDFLDKEDDEIARTYPNFTRNNGTLSAEKYIPELYRGTGGYVWFTATRLFDDHGNIEGTIQCVRDVTSFKATEHDLEQTKERFTLAVEGNSTGIWDWDKKTDQVYYSPRWKSILGFADHEFPNTIEAWKQRIHPEDYDRVMEANNILTPEQPCFEVEYRVKTKGNSYTWIAGHGIAKWDANGVLARTAGSHMDISNRKQNELAVEALLRVSTASNRIRNSKELFKQIHDILKEIIRADNFFIALWNKDKKTIYFPYVADELEDRQCYTKTPIDLNIEEPGLTTWVLRNAKPLFVTREDTLMQYCRGPRPQVWIGVPIMVGNLTQGIMCVQDYHDPNHFTENNLDFLYAVAELTALALDRKQIEELRAFHAMHDPLTALPNRALFCDRLAHCIKRAHRQNNYNFAVMMIDLDRFKKINDTMGHTTGDHLLRELALRIQPTLRDADTIARLGGDEFIIILEDFHNPREIITIAKRILASIQAPFYIGSKKIHTNASMGIVINTAQYTHSENILRDVDIAMYEAKKMGPGKFRVFNKHMHQQAIKVMSLENDLRQALQEEQIWVAYQPIFSIDPMEISGFEALARWNHPQKGPIGPDIFIPIAEETGLIHTLGQYVLDQACATLAQWNATPSHHTPLVMTVNLSPKELAHPLLVEEISTVLQKHAIAEHTLKIEITESTFMEHPKSAHQILHRLKKLGLYLAVDDFGTGYSSLSYLQKLPVDTLKVDRSFVFDLHTNPTSRVIARAILALAHSLGKDVIAEGVEIEEQLNILRGLGCEKVQGFYMSKPLAKDDAQKFLEKWRGAEKTGPHGNGENMG